MLRWTAAAPLAVILGVLAIAAPAAETVRGAPAAPGGMMPYAGPMPMMGVTMPSMMGAGGIAGMPMAGGRGMPMMSAMTGHVDGWLALLKTELKVTDAQLPLWNGLAQVIRENARSAGTMRAQMFAMMQEGVLPDRLASHEKFMTERLAALRKFKSAADPFYAALSPDQKKTADELLTGPMAMM